MSTHIFKLPDVGEGLTEAEIVSWRVAEGDEVALNQVVLEIETAKSLVELPSPFTGRMARLLVPEGKTVSVGTPIYEVADDAEPQGSDPAGGENAASAPEADAASLAAADNADEVMKPLVGTGPKAESVTRRRRRSGAAGSTAQARPAADTPAPAPAAGVAAAPAPSSSAPVERPLAKPPVRKAAKDAGVDLADCTPTGLRGEVTRKDLEDFIAQRDAEDAPKIKVPLSGIEIGTAAAIARQAHEGGPGFSRGFTGDVERVPVRSVRKMTAAAMVDSAFTAPHVTVFKEVDATATMELVQRLKKRRDFEGIKISPLLIVAKAVIYALERNRTVNSMWAGEEILVKNFVNLGIAAATPRGLMVPNIKNVHEMGLRELAIAINTLILTAREGRTRPAEMQQGTFTITNIGSLGLDSGTPIINPGEAAILAFGTIRQKPWVVDGEIKPRWVTTVGGSFDHRIVDGDVAAQFTVDVASVLEDPLLLLS
ncbi:dihydrolipoamide acetyltransferase family protein [Falsarthrobacter nasiphocae]|uniref:Dihydrolipoamide acetyltransferase component of pyruvate dehydrogenase complex n=1 Tax=Falsarthrobacter nasiphocae TaxID=189863 RepID=A0AAE3YH88_9MICC|nr:dihydrolipoamide acetyltransferase family protein [Falsarthrobacter nasiphocae]MDR6892160.1 pyruvate dehydrogenase E2 component (dihydrolipoamide acetyltransferase) [Falsarthrobacter nasiphocae]